MSASSNSTPDASALPTIALFCVGNKLMLDDGLGTAVYDELINNYNFPEQVVLFDVGCMSLDMLEHVNTFDVLITVDAVDGTKSEVGTIFEFAPDDMEVKRGASASLHELTLADLFEAATLVDYSAQGICLGMQVENLSPEYATIGLTPKVHERLPYLVDTVLATLYKCGAHATHKESGKEVTPGWHHDAN